MPNQNASEIKEKILSTIRKNGPSLPVQIASAVELSPLFASAFLSELISEKRIKTSTMRVGNSPLYLIPGQENQLKNFSQHLKSREKEAYILLEKKQFLKDIEQEPAIRVALRQIPDFAKAFKKNEEIFWRYYEIPESRLEIKNEPKKIEPIKKETSKEQVAPQIQKIPAKKKTRSNTTKKTDDKFLEKVKDYLSKQKIEIASIEGFGKSELMLKIKADGKEQILVAYNKKRITETDIVKAHKKAAEFKIPYTILCLAEPSQKLSGFIEALRNLSTIEKIE